MQLPAFARSEAPLLHRISSIHDWVMGGAGFGRGLWGVGEGGRQGLPAEGVVDGGQDVGAVLGGGGDVAADGVPVAGDRSERRRPEIFCWVNRP